jgi:hypothetical protein
METNASHISPTLSVPCTVALAEQALNQHLVAVTR